MSNIKEKTENISEEEISEHVEPEIIHSADSALEALNTQSETLEQYRPSIQDAVASVSSRREALEVEVDAVAECVAIAADIYKTLPSLDNATQLASLINAHKGALAQLEKMKDPKLILSGIEDQIKIMFLELLKSLANAVNQVRRDLISRYPNDRSTLEDSFSRILEAIEPSTLSLYGDLYESLKKILGVKR